MFGRTPTSIVGGVGENTLNTGLVLEHKYKLHHFMMGKGKTTVITPLVSLFNHFIYKKMYS